MSRLAALTGPRSGVLEGKTWVPAVELTSAVRTLAAELAKKPLYSRGPGALDPPVALFLDPSIAYVTGLLAALEAHAVFVPISPSWPPAKIKEIVKDCKPHLILTTRVLLPNLDEALNFGEIKLRGDGRQGPTNAGGQVLLGTEYILEEGFAGGVLLALSLKVPATDGCGRLLSLQKEDPDVPPCQAPPAPSSPAPLEDQTLPEVSLLELPGRAACCYVLYTSGSTGQPKGVCGTWQGLQNRLQWMAQAYPYQQDDVACFKTAVGFVDHLTELLGPLLAGARVVIPPPHELSNNPLALLDYLEAQRVTRLVAVPSLLRMLLGPLEACAHAGHLLSLRVVVCSGEALPWELATRLQAALPRTTLLNLYGSTEVTGDVLFLDVTRHLAAGAPLAGSLVPIGRPILNHDAMLVNECQEEIQADYEAGELCVAGPGLCCGYLGDPAATRAAFLRWPPAKDDDRSSSAAPETARGRLFYRTGDLAQRSPYGTYVWLGRKDRQVKVRGHRVQLEEVEAAFVSSPLVHAVAVKAWPTQGHALSLAAYVVAQQQQESWPAPYQETQYASLLQGVSLPTPLLPAEQQVVVECVRQHVRRSLVEAATPPWILLVARLPLTSSGKVDYAALPPPALLRPLHAKQATATLAGGGLQGGKQVQGTANLAGSNHAAVLRAFERVLGTGHLEGDTDFFSVGGNSVTAAELAHILGVDMRCVYAHRTSRSLATALQGKGAWSAPSAREPARGVVHHSLGGSTASGWDMEGTSWAGEEGDREHAARVGVSEAGPLRSAGPDPDGSSGAGDVIMWDSEEEAVAGTEVLDERLASMRGAGLTALPADSAAKGGPTHVPLPAVLDAAGTPCVQCSAGGGLDGLVQAQGAFWATRGNHVQLLGGAEGAGHSIGGLPRRSLPVLQEWRLSSSAHVSLHVAWASPLGQCVDASPLLLVGRHPAPRLFIGSHAHQFACLEAASGARVWVQTVGGRVEATAAVTADGAHVVFGCYDGCVYVLDVVDGSITWTFRTKAEVKCQAVVDPWAGFVWCGSHDHCLYVLHVAAMECLLAHDCGGSVYGAPAFDAVRGRAYVATTGGHVVAFNGHTLELVWRVTLGAPLFASPAVTSDGLLLCCSVAGHVTALSPSGAVAWHTPMGGPVFAPPCLSPPLPGQALICSRDGHVQGLDVTSGAVLWDLPPETPLVGEPLTAAAAVDETVLLQTPGSTAAARLVWVCGSRGTVRAVAVSVSGQAGEAAKDGHGGGQHSDGDADPSQLEDQKQHEDSKRPPPCNDVAGAGPPAERPWSLPRVLAAGRLAGDVFSSPVAVAGSLYLGCRDDHVYKLHLAVEEHREAQS